MDVVIRLENLSKSFGDACVLSHVNRDFEAGKIHGIVGNNGSGKTVMMKCICGFLQPTEGRVWVNYKLVGKDVDFPPDMGIIIETPGFLPNLSGRKNLEAAGGATKEDRCGDDSQDADPGRTGPGYEEAGQQVFAGDAAAPWYRAGDHGRAVAADSG